MPDVLLFDSLEKLVSLALATNFTAKATSIIASQSKLVAKVPRRLPPVALDKPIHSVDGLLIALSKMFSKTEAIEKRPI